MINRRQILKTVIAASAGAAALHPEILFARAKGRQATNPAGENIYVTPASGRDSNSGAKDAPLKSLPYVTIQGLKIMGAADCRNTQARVKEMPLARHKEEPSE